MTGVKNSILYIDPKDTTSLTSVSASYSYDDYYHAKSTDRARNPSLRAEALVESPRFSGEAFIKRPHWALSPSWNVRKGFARSSNVDDTYYYRAALNSNKAGIAGWTGADNMFFAGYIGWNFISMRDRSTYRKDEFPNNQAASNFANEKCDYEFSAGCSFNDVLVSAYLKKTLQPAFTFTIINTANNAKGDFDYIGLRHTVGLRATLKKSFVLANLDAGLSDYLSDTLSSAAASIPLTVNSRMLHGSVEAVFPLIKLQPSFMLSGGIAQPEIRGFDGPGGSLFFNLDETQAYGASVSLSVNPQDKYMAGIAAELFSFNNLASGKLDPFLFSTMSLFMPDKYKIDSLAGDYRSYGIFGEKRIKPLSWWQCNALGSASWVRLTSFSNTREWDFSFIIPRLIDPQKNVFIGDDYALFVIRLANEFCLHKAKISATLQQAIPMHLKSRNAGGIQSSQPEDNVKRSVRGGTRCCLGVGYEF